MTIKPAVLAAIGARRRSGTTGGGGGGGDWTPAEISTALWFDASDSATITETGSPSTVSAWNDKSGNARHASQATAALQPTCVRGVLNGRSVIRFDGIDNRLATAAASLHSGTWSAFAVARRTNTTGTALLISQDRTSGSTRVAQYLRTLNADIQTAGFNTLGSAFLNNATATITDWVIYGGIRASTLITAYANGRTFGSPTGTTTTGTAQTGNVATHIGAFDNAVDFNSHWAGDIAEIVVIDGVISVADREKMEGYLAHKWGLIGSPSWLPTGHPYENVAPTV